MNTDFDFILNAACSTGCSITPSCDGCLDLGMAFWDWTTVASASREMERFFGGQSERREDFSFRNVWSDLCPIWYYQGPSMPIAQGLPMSESGAGHDIWYGVVTVTSQEIPTKTLKIVWCPFSWGQVDFWVVLVKRLVASPSKRSHQPQLLLTVAYILGNWYAK